MVTIVCTCGQVSLVTQESHDKLLSSGGRYACRD